MRHFPAILLVWLGCTFAWVVLGTSLVARTGSKSGSLGDQVHLLWGPELDQKHPSASYDLPRTVVDTEVHKDEHGREVTQKQIRNVIDTIDVPLVGSSLRVGLDLTHRRKGLLWFPTYAVDFSGRYTFANPGGAERFVRFVFPLGCATNTYDGFQVSDAGGQPVDADVAGERATWTARLEPGERRAYTVRYRSRGTSTWSYGLTGAGAGRVRDFLLVMTTNFRNVDFAPGSIAPTESRTLGHGWTGTWRFESLVASAPIGLVLPERINPGPLASRITFFAPVGLLFFFFVVAILTTARGHRIHPMNYFFFGCAFFAFHLLFAYLVDHLAILPSFAIASLTSVLLVISYARLFTGWKFATGTIGAAQLVYLVLFSTTFFWEGFTGLAITVGAVLTLFVMMQVTGRLDWARHGEPLAPKPA